MSIQVVGTGAIETFHGYRNGSMTVRTFVLSRHFAHKLGGEYVCRFYHLQSALLSQRVSILGTKSFTQYTFLIQITFYFFHYQYCAIVPFFQTWLRVCSQTGMWELLGIWSLSGRATTSQVRPSLSHTEGRHIEILKHIHRTYTR